MTEKKIQNDNGLNKREDHPSSHMWSLEVGEPGLIGQLSCGRPPGTRFLVVPGPPEAVCLSLEVSDGSGRISSSRSEVGDKGETASCLSSKVPGSWPLTLLLISRTEAHGHVDLQGD